VVTLGTDAFLWLVSQPAYICPDLPPPHIQVQVYLSDKSCLEAAPIRSVQQASCLPSQLTWLDPKPTYPRDPTCPALGSSFA
jgi:hypothetical protein